jgi:predicted phosphate transport protein (TIGR00153 family)
MKMNILPKEQRFFVLFEQQAQYAAEAAKLLTAAVMGDPANLRSYAAQIRDVEHEGDLVTHDIMTRLDQTFLTPIDPEDIHRLASKLDDVLDMIDAAIGRLVLYKVMSLPPEMAALAQIVEACSLALVKAIRAMSREDPVIEHLIEINRLENEADRVNREGLAELFETETNAIQVIKLKEIYEILESASDMCEDVANVIESVVLKNA